MPPYSIGVSATALSIGAKDILRASNCRRITPLISALEVAKIMQAACQILSARFAFTTMQLADTSLPIL